MPKFTHTRCLNPCLDRDANPAAGRGRGIFDVGRGIFDVGICRLSALVILGVVYFCANSTCNPDFDRL